MVFILSPLVGFYSRVIDLSRGQTIVFLADYLPQSQIRRIR